MSEWTETRTKTITILPKKGSPSQTGLDITANFTERGLSSVSLHNPGNPASPVFIQESVLRQLTVLFCELVGNQ